MSKRNRFASLAVLLILVGSASLMLGACSDDTQPVLLDLTAGRDLQVTTPCNGQTALCSRHYNEVAFPGTHDAYSNTQENFGIPDQTYPITRQLADGIRVLHLEALPYMNDIYLCHATCTVGNVLLSKILTDVKTFVESHPAEVVTLLTESTGVKRDQLAPLFMASGIMPYLHMQTAGQPWPTLGDMINRGTRVVVYHFDKMNAGGTVYPWLHDRFSFTWETPWDNQTETDFLRCNADRGTQGNSIYVVDNYYENELIPTPGRAAMVNNDPFLIDRVTHCRQFANQLPNFVMVNYYEVGDVFKVVDALNGFSSTARPDYDAFPPLD